MIAMLTDKIYENWMAPTQREKIAQILKKVKIPKGARVLDIGCGPGFLEEKIPWAVAVDINPEYLKKIKGEKILSSGDELSFSQEFDFVFCIDILHLLKNPKKVSEYVKPNGCLIVSIFCNESNSEERLNKLKNLFHNLELKKSFVVKAEKEWDAVCVFKTQA